MLYPKTSNCLECAQIQPLLDDIDCKLKDMSMLLYSNIVFMLGKQISYTSMLDLINYKRILQYKKVNPDYASKYSINQIASRIKILKYK